MATFTDFAVSGVTENTPKNIMLGAGTIYRDLEYDETNSQWTGTLIGATSGGTKVTITPEFLDIEVDGVTVKAKGLAAKVGETATLETNVVEVTEDWVKSTVVGVLGTSVDSRFNVIESTATLAEGNYIENLAYVGFMTDGTPVLIKFDYALCTSGLELEGKNKENAVTPATFECYADLSAGLTNKLPYHIYVAKATV